MGYNTSYIGFLLKNLINKAALGNMGEIPAASSGI
jgi:hypothetical protein